MAPSFQKLGPPGNPGRFNLVDPAKIGCLPETLRSWVHRSERGQSVRPGQTTDEHERIKAPGRKVRELRQGNEILRNASAYFAFAELDRRSRP